MAVIRKKGNKEVPPISTASLPDVIFMILFFFMTTTSMKETELRVHFQLPEATEVQKLEKKSLVTFIYIGVPNREYQAKMGTEARVQLNDKIEEVSAIQDYIAQEKSSMNEEDQPYMTVSIKADRDTKMGLITDVKQALREAYALKISYSATPAVN